MTITIILHRYYYYLLRDDDPASLGGGGVVVVVVVRTRGVWRELAGGRGGGVVVFSDPAGWNGRESASVDPRPCSGPAAGKSPPTTLQSRARHQCCALFCTVRTPRTSHTAVAKRLFSRARFRTRRVCPSDLDSNDTTKRIRQPSPPPDRDLFATSVFLKTSKS